MHAAEDVVSSCLIIQHVEAEGSFAVGEALSSAGVTVDTRRVRRRPSTRRRLDV